MKLLWAVGLLATFSQASAELSVRLPTQLGGGPEIPLNATEREALRLIERWTRQRARPGQGKNGGVVYTYGATLPTVVCQPLAVCVIELEPGEQVQGAPHLGDTARWMVSPMLSGTRNGQTVTSLNVKPSDTGLQTHLVIPTDRRIYNIKLISSSRRTMHRVQFAYPEDMLNQWRDYRHQVSEREANEVAVLPALTAESIHFDYTIVGDDHWAPVRVFDDGQKTYFQLADDTQVAPALFLVENGERKLINYRVRRGYYIADRVVRDSDRWEMVYGKNSRSALISRTTARRRQGGYRHQQTAASPWGHNQR